jgi:hypothetical protein
LPGRSARGGVDVAESVVSRDALLRYPEVQRALVKEAMPF